MLSCPITKDEEKSKLRNEFCPMIFIGESTCGDVYWCKECGTIRSDNCGDKRTYEYILANIRTDKL
jgi:hypothetical protein